MEKNIHFNFIQLLKLKEESIHKLYLIDSSESYLFWNRIQSFTSNGIFHRCIAQVGRCHGNNKRSFLKFNVKENEAKSMQFVL